ncbi:MAG: hypothetical protein Kow00124_30850 [Anaerolineae bacterium]
MVKRRFAIKGMHCVGCTMAVETAIERLDGVRSAAANYAREYADVAYDDQRVTEEQITGAVALAGYEMVPPDEG